MNPREFDRRFLAGFWLVPAILVAVALVGVTVWLKLDASPHSPTPDQLYGCTVKQQAPNGECP